MGEYPLAWAASVDDKRTYNLLISYGADPNLQDTFGNMILHVIVAKERLVCMRCMKEMHTDRPSDHSIIHIILMILLLLLVF